MLGDIFGIPKLPAPDKETLEELTPEGASQEIALFAWREGWIDGKAGNEYRMLQDNAEFQPLYSHGFETGEREKAIHDEFERTRQDIEHKDEGDKGYIKLKKVKEVKGPKPPRHTLYIRRSLNFCEAKRFAFQGFCYLMVGMLAAQVLVQRGLGR